MPKIQINAEFENILIGKTIWYRKIRNVYNAHSVQYFERMKLNTDELVTCKYSGLLINDCNQRYRMIRPPAFGIAK